MPEDPIIQPTPWYRDPIFWTNCGAGMLTGLFVIFVIRKIENNQ